MKTGHLVADLGKQLVGRLLQKSVHLAKMRYHYDIDRKYLQYKGPMLLLYQMGKVGSKTIRSSLQALELGIPMFHVHFLSSDRIRETERERRKYFGTEREGLLRRIWQYQYLRKRIASGLDGFKWKVVTLTREPISRNISAFFENLDVTRLDTDRRYHIKSDYYGFEIVLSIEDVDKLVQLFLEKLPHDRPLTFFDHELKGVLGIDVFADEFPRSRGYKIYEKEGIDVLLVRLENLNECAREAFKEFLGIEEFALTNTNVGGAKGYASLYKGFKDSIVLPQTYIDRMYTSKYMQHFYSEEEIAGFRLKWRVSGN